MKKLTRYVLFELLQAFLLTLAALTALIFVGLIAREAVRRGLGLGPLLRMTPYLLPQAMQFAVPGSLLLATTSVYGRFSAANEVVAAKALGISPWVLARPTLVLAAATSLGAVALNDLAVSWGRLGVQRVFVESLEGVIYRQLTLHRSYSEGGVQINVRRVEGRRLIRPIVTVHSGSGDPWTIASASAEIRSLPKEHKLLVLFAGVHVEGPDGSVAIARPTEREIDLRHMLGEGNAGRRPANYALSEIPAEERRVLDRLDGLRREQTAQQALSLTTGDFSRLESAEWADHERRVGGERARLRRLGLEPYRRWSAGFSCLGFAMVGVPMAIWRQRGEFLASFFYCFAPILLVYYPLLMLSVDQAKAGAAPAVVVWIGNVVLALWGLWMMRRVVSR